jgi:hypothetical protein
MDLILKGGSLKGTVLAVPLKLMGPVMNVIITSAAVQTAFDIQRNERVGPLSIAPFLSLVTCGMIRFSYGVGIGYPSVIIANLVCTVGGLFCTSIYLKYSTMTRTTAGLIAAVMCLVAWSWYVAFEGSLGTVGIIGDIVTVLLCASPLSTFLTVISERSTASMPFAISCATWVNAMVSTNAQVHSLSAHAPPSNLTPSLFRCGCRTDTGLKTTFISTCPTY